MTRLPALLATLRIANAPSVAGNVWLGFMLGVYYFGAGALLGEFDATVDTGSIASAAAKLLGIGLSLYFAGNLLNDLADHGWDRLHRPERALPSGLFPPVHYKILVGLLVTLALVLAAGLGSWTLAVALAILFFISVYTWMHKRTRWAVVPMGLCRAGLYLLGFSPFLHGFPVTGETGSSFARVVVQHERIEWLLGLAFLATHALGLFIYIAGLSLAARYESTEHPPHGMVLVSRAMLFLPLAAMSSWWMPYYPLTASVALLPFATWLALGLTRFRKPVPRFVSALLAGIPLIDFIAALPLAVALALPDQGLHQQPLLLATVLVPPAAFVAALLLQKVAPAT